MKAAALCVGFLLLSSRLGSAQQPTVHVGAGASSCGEWVAVVDNNQESNILKHAMFVSWVQGYLYGAAVAMTQQADGFNSDFEASRARFGTDSGMVYDPPDADAVTYWITNFCRQHALDRITVASVALFTEIYNKAVQSRPKSGARND